MLPRILLSSLALLGALVPSVLAQSQVVAWGASPSGECTVPALPAGRTFAAVATGPHHVVARLSDGTAMAWGSNTVGQCNVPALAPGLSVLELAAGYQHSLALLSDGSVVGWGANTQGQCNVPPAPVGLSYTQVSGGGSHSIALLSDGSAVAWGSNNVGQCTVPALPAGLSYVEVAAGYLHSVALRSDGSVVAWGSNYFGQCNVLALPAGLVYVEVACGSGYTLALRSDGSVVAWGANDSGQCNVPALPPGLLYTALTASDPNCAARRSDGSIVAWGGPAGSGVGNVPALPNGYTYVEVSAGGNFVVARVDSGDCNGNGVNDQLDVQGGTSADCNGNGLPDECDLPHSDCDGNGLIDSCEIAANPGLDLTLDGVLDSCNGVCNTFWRTNFGGAAGINGSVSAMTVFDDGSGAALYVGGSFTNAGGVAVSNIAKWDGSSWYVLGTGITGGTVKALAVYDDGSGPALYAGGTFTSAGGAPAINVAKWNGLTWSALGGGPLYDVTSLAVYDFGTGPSLYSAGGHSIERWDGSAWTWIQSWSMPYDDYTRVVCVYDYGAGPRIYAAGFGDMGTADLHSWNGISWSGGPLGMLNSSTQSLAAYDVGDGQALYLGLGISSSAPECVRRWNGTQMTGLGAMSSNANVSALQGFDDGHGKAMFAGGHFTLVGGVAVSNIARWDGTSWSALGSGTSGDVKCMCVFDDGNGPLLYLGGAFASAGGVPSNHIARWGTVTGCWRDDLCEAGQQGVMSCPCSNPPAGAGRGCDNGAHTGGAQLSTNGRALVSNDSLLFTTSGQTPTAASIVMQGVAQLPGGATFGHGVRCVNGTLKRLYLKAAVAGAIVAPGPGDLSVTARSAVLGDPLAPGMHRFYGVYYRDPIPLGGCTALSGFNITQQLDVLWQP